jgi:hypothetical protein
MIKESQEGSWLPIPSQRAALDRCSAFGAVTSTVIVVANVNRARVLANLERNVKRVQVDANSAS